MPRFAEPGPEEEGVEFSTRPTKLLLLILVAGGETRKYNEPVAGRTKLMKELFLLQQRDKKVAPRYDFKPYDYGPFSQQIWSDLEELKVRGLIDSENLYPGETYFLTPRGVAVARVLWSHEDPKTLERIFDIKVRFNRMPLSQLLSYVYSSYPQYASKSVLESFESSE